MCANIGTMKISKTSASKELSRIVGSQRRLADVLDVHEETVSRWVRGAKAEPEYLTALFELISVVPPKDWPERWR